MRRIGSNIRKQNNDAKAHRIVRNIIKYTDDQPARNDYPKKIVSPSNPSKCCSDDSREVVGTMREIDGFKFCYKICSKCGHAVKFFFPAAVTTSKDPARPFRVRGRWWRYLRERAAGMDHSRRSRHRRACRIRACRDRR